MVPVVSAEEGLSVAELEIMRSVEDDHWWYRALRGHVIASLRLPNRNFALLDAGCGSGGMLARLHAEFPAADLTGLDISEHALQLTKDRGSNAQLVLGSVDRLPFEDARFDAVVSLDVLYHRDVDDRMAVREMHRVLRPGGVLLLNLPAFDFLRGSHDVAINTARRYTRSQLARLLREANFTIETLTYWNMLLLPAVAAVRWASRGKTEVRSDLSSPPAAVNELLGGIARTELALSRRMPLPFGTSLFAVARK